MEKRSSYLVFTRDSMGRIIDAHRVFENDYQTSPKEHLPLTARTSRQSLQAKSSFPLFPNSKQS